MHLVAATAGSDAPAFGCVDEPREYARYYPTRGHRGSRVVVHPFQRRRAIMAIRSEPNVGDTNPSAGLTRRQFLPLLGAAAMAASAPRSAAAAQSTADSRYVYVGTYTAPGVPPGGTHPSTAVGIYVFTMSPRDGKLT